MWASGWGCLDSHLPHLSGPFPVPMMSLFLSVLFPSLVTYPGNLHSFHNTPKARVHGYLLQTGPLPGCICTSTIFRKHLAVPPLHPPNTWKEDAGLSQPRSSALAVLCAPLARARNLVISWDLNTRSPQDQLCHCPASGRRGLEHLDAAPFPTRGSWANPAPSCASPASHPEPASQ